MTSRRQGRNLGQTALRLAAVTFACAAATLPTTAAAAASAAPPANLFRPGYDLCHAASLAALRKVAHQRFKAGTFSHSVCTWERTDLRAGVALSTHPTAVGKALMRMFKAQSGKQHVTARAIQVPRATRALLVTLPGQVRTERTKYLFAAYRDGVIQVNMTAPHSLPASRLKAVLGLIARTRR